MPLCVVFTLSSYTINAKPKLTLRSAVVWVSRGLPWVVPRLGLSRWEQQFPEDGCIERTKDRLVEADDSPKGRPQRGELGAHQPEGRGQLWTPFSGASLQHGLEGTLHPFSCVCVCVMGGAG